MNKPETQATMETRPRVPTKTTTNMNKPETQATM